MLASAAKAYLFLIRVRAIYGNSKLVTLLVGMGWLAVVSARMTVPSMVHTAVSRALFRLTLKLLSSF